MLYPEPMDIRVNEPFGTKPTLEFTSPTAPEGLEVIVLSEGDGPEVKAGDQISAHYLGQIWDGDVFDNSFDRGAPLDFRVGVGMVIRGWDEGLIGQRVGSRVLLSIPSAMGYGARGVPGTAIKGGDTLVFVTDIVSAR